MTIRRSFRVSTKMTEREWTRAADVMVQRNVDGGSTEWRGGDAGVLTTETADECQAECRKPGACGRDRDCFAASFTEGKCFCFGRESGTCETSYVAYIHDTHDLGLSSGYNMAYMLEACTDEADCAMRANRHRGTSKSFKELRNDGWVNLRAMMGHDHCRPGFRATIPQHKEGPVWCGGSKDPFEECKDGSTDHTHVFRSIREKQPSCACVKNA